jgi:hypothetical protein
MTSEGKLESSPPYSFEISHMSAKKTKVVDFDAQYSPYDAKVYGLRTAFHGKDDTDKPDPRDMIPYSSAMVMVDAAVHCSDRASHRKAVHDPDAEGPLLHEASFLRKTNTKYPGVLSDDDRKLWKNAIDGLRPREEARKKVRVVDGKSHAAEEVAAWDQTPLLQKRKRPKRIKMRSVTERGL